MSGETHLRAFLESAPDAIIIADREGHILLVNALGVHFAIDDFGTGYSSPAYLKQLPPSSLEIDQGFVRGILRDVNDAAIVTAVISMAHKLGFRAVAEGVETHQQPDVLGAEGSDHAQGYFFSVPLSALELRELLAGYGETG